MIKFVIVGLVGLLGSSLGQETSQCMCVNPDECVNGVTIPTATGRIIDADLERCNGLRTCCKLAERSGRSSYPSSSSSGSSPAGAVAPAAAPVAPDAPPSAACGRPRYGIDDPVLPNIVQLRGCGVRRTKGFPKPQRPSNPRSGQPRVTSTMRRFDADPECEPPSKPSWPKVSLSQQRVSAGEDEPVDTFYGELPWMVRVNINGKFECGGTLIGLHTVMTAAHCVKGKQAADLTVEAGEWDTTSNREPQATQKREVITVTRHQDFDSETGQHDVALLYTKQAFDKTETVDEICLGERFHFVNQKDCYWAGWGKIKATDKDFPPLLRKTPIPLLNNSHCEKLFRETKLGPQFVLLGGFVCAGGLDNRNTCKGDGGGPLYCSTIQNPDRFAVVGVISWGLDCDKGHPTVVASVPYYRKWIEHQNNEWMNTVLPTLGDRSRIYK